MEGYHQCLKTGLQVERRQYESADHLRPVIGLICVQAVRLLQLRDVARRAPDTPAGQLVPPEWLEFVGKVLRKPRPLNTVREFLRALASLGGFPVASPTANRAGGQSCRGLETLLAAGRGDRAAPSKNVGKDEPVELVLGLLLCLGLFTRWTLVAGGLWMIALVFGRPFARTTRRSPFNFSTPSCFSCCKSGSRQTGSHLTRCGNQKVDMRLKCVLPVAIVVFLGSIPASSAETTEDPRVDQRNRGSRREIIPN